MMLFALKPTAQFVTTIRSCALQVQRDYRLIGIFPIVCRRIASTQRVPKAMFRDSRHSPRWEHERALTTRSEHFQREQTDKPAFLPQ